jgi:hypothetical protein
MKVLLFLFVFLSALFCASLEEMLKQLQTTPKDQRYKLVNNIKREMAKLNQAQRLEAIRKLKKGSQIIKSANASHRLKNSMRFHQDKVEENSFQHNMIKHREKFQEHKDKDRQNADFMDKNHNQNGYNDSHKKNMKDDFNKHKGKK